MTLDALDIATGYGAAIYLAVVVGLLIWNNARTDTRLGIALARAKRAEEACEELRKSLMRGSAVGRWRRHDTAPGADEWYHHVHTVEGPLLPTDEQWQVARNRAAKLITYAHTR